MANSPSNAATFLEDGSNKLVNITNSHVFVGQGQQTIVSPLTGAEPVQEGEIDVSSTGYTVLFEDIFVRNQGPMREGTKVFKGYQKHADGQRVPVAIKVITPCSDKNLREVGHLVSLTPHDNVVRIFRSKRTVQLFPELYIVMELCKAETFKDYCEKTPFDFNQIMSYCKQLVKGIKHIHDNKIIHGDLKPENILLSLDGRLIKVSDFGISKQLRKGETHTRLTSRGTDSFRAPETFHSDKISTSADIHSLGVILFGAFTKGKHPFGEDPQTQVYNVAKSKGYNLSGLPDEMEDLKKKQLYKLLERMLESDARRRPTIDEVLEDGFFTSWDAPSGPGESDSKADFIPRQGSVTNQTELRKQSTKTTNEDTFLPRTGPIDFMNTEKRATSLNLSSEPKLEIADGELQATWVKVSDDDVTYHIDLFCDGQKTNSEPYATPGCDMVFHNIKPGCKYCCQIWVKNSYGAEGIKKWSNLFRTDDSFKVSETEAKPTSTRVVQIHNLHSLGHTIIAGRRHHIDNRQRGIDNAETPALRETSEGESREEPEDEKSKRVEED